MRHCSTAKKDFRSNRPKRAYFRQMADMRENKGEGLCLTQPLSFAPRSPFCERRQKKTTAARELRSCSFIGRASARD